MKVPPVYECEPLSCSTPGPLFTSAAGPLSAPCSIVPCTAWIDVALSVPKPVSVPSSRFSAPTKFDVEAFLERRAPPLIVTLPPRGSVLLAPRTRVPPETKVPPS
jgi:hypothetical protein